MKKVIERIHKRTTEYSHPSQATTTANALDLLSSGIYTEEERFVFELLQNAVDSYEPNTSSGLDIKIIVKDNKLMFLHNGQPFSERDLEGLCDIGNGNKMSDAKKIGYKGIGFKSVFMHSKRVIVVTAGTAFKFDEEACKLLAQNKGSEYKDVKMPWQIIPIPIDKPSLSESQEYTVATILEVNNGVKLLGKVKKLLSDARFLLFLNVGNLKMTLLDGETEILSLSKNQNGDLLTLSKNGEPQNKWLIYSKSVRLTPEVKVELVHDTKTPDKLKKSDAVEISFAIALDKDDRIIPLTDAVVYTYLPTSYSFGFSFIVNANFITDAGRQQLIKDCEWNKFIFSQIPALYLNWIKDVVAPKYQDWFSVLPYASSYGDDLSVVFNQSLGMALNKIPFVKSINGRNILIKEVIIDAVNILNVLPESIMNKFIHNELSKFSSCNSFVSVEEGDYLKPYGVLTFNNKTVGKLLESSSNYLFNLKDEEYSTFFNWLVGFSNVQTSGFKDILQHSKFLPNEKNILIEPVNIFIPSAYREENELADDANVIRPSLFQILNHNVIEWLMELGVQEMSNLSVIERVLCKAGFITKDNAIEVMRFIFDCDKKENVFSNIDTHILSQLKILTQGGNLKSGAELYLADIYNPVCKIEKYYPLDIFINNNYSRSSSEISDWSIFFRKLGAGNDIELSSIDYRSGSWVMSDYSISNCVSTAKNTEYVHSYWNGNNYYLGCAGGVRVTALSSPFLNPKMLPDNYDTFEFYQNFWSRIFAGNTPKREDDYIFGLTGNGYSKRAFLKDDKYLGKSFIGWLVNKWAVIPASDGKLHTISNVLPYTSSNIETFSSYYPVCSVEITSNWNDILSFKKDLTIQDYLDILERISEDDSSEKISENKERILRIYDRIYDSICDFSDSSSEINKLRNWGKSHTLLSKELKFEKPQNLCLLSSRISGVNISNQAYHQKYQENDRFAAMMIALGVNMISDHRVEGLDDAIEKPDIKNKIQGKVDFLTVISTSESFTEESWNESRIKMAESIDKLYLLQTDSIRVVYGTQAIDKPIYVKDNNLYFVGKFGAGVQELLSSDIVRLLGLHKSDQTTFLTILRMTDYEEIKEYLSQKGYDVNFLKEPELPQIIGHTSGNAILGGEEPLLGGLTKDQMRAALVEAKDAILAKLSCEGYDTSSAQWDGWTCVDGIQKNGEEYPLVIRSNKSGRNTILSDIDWNQLMRPNAMFVVNTGNGIGTINFKQLLKSKENITIRFGSENIDMESGISRLAEAFSFFKGMQFDFESYVTPIISRWQSFMAPENNTGELPEASDTSFLPE